MIAEKRLHLTMLETFTEKIENNEGASDRERERGGKGREIDRQRERYS